MRRLGLLTALSVLALAAATPASAKEVTSAQICGASGCVDVDDHATLTALAEGGPNVPPPDRGAPWFRAELAVSAEGEEVHSFPVAVVPSQRLVRGGDRESGFAWAPISAKANESIRSAASSLVPLPASKLTGTGRPEVIVDEVILPRDDPAGGGTPWGWILGGLAAAALVAGLVVVLRRWGGATGPAAPQSGSPRR